MVADMHLEAEKVEIGTVPEQGIHVFKTSLQLIGNSR